MKPIKYLKYHLSEMYYYVAKPCFLFCLWFVYLAIGICGFATGIGWGIIGVTNIVYQSPQIDFFLTRFVDANGNSVVSFINMGFMIGTALLAISLLVWGFFVIFRDLFHSYRSFKG